MIGRNRLIRLRKELKMTQVKIAEIVGIEQTT